MKKLVYLALVIFNIFSLTQPVWAVNVISQNSDNAAESTNIASVSIEQQTTLSQINQTNLQNTVNLNLNTGSNVQNQSVGNTSTQTGGITAQTQTSNDVNRNEAILGCGACVENVSAINNDNGANSKNTAQISDQTNLQVSQSNQTKIQNETLIDANTGRNQANQNVGDTAIQTGDILVEVIEKNLAGLNFFKDPLGGNGEGVEARNQGNGAGSQNDPIVSFVRNTKVEVNNFAQVGNKVAVTANTGDNHCNQNVGNCQIETGDITIKIGIDNKINENETIVVKKPAPTPTIIPPVPSLTVTPTVTPTPTRAPSPTPPGGGPISPTITPPAKLTPTPWAKGPSPTPGEEAKKEKELPPLLEEILQKIIPAVQAAIPKVEVKEGQVLGITELPVTGLGGAPYQIGFLDLWPGILMLGFGLALRRLEKLSDSKKGGLFQFSE